MLWSCRYATFASILSAGGLFGGDVALGRDLVKQVPCKQVASHAVKPQRFLTFDTLPFSPIGFTGRRTATRIARNPPRNPNFKWAIASRIEDKPLLEGLLEEIAKDLAPTSKISLPEIIIANAKNHNELMSFTTRAKVVINTVGPFRYFGVNVVKACVEGGAHYIDCCGEPEFYERCYLECSKSSRENNVVVVHAAGWDSVPADLGVLACKLEFAKRGGVCNAVEMYHTLEHGPLGFSLNYATYASAVRVRCFLYCLGC